jgi:hypothetical protein
MNIGSSLESCSRNPLELALLEQVSKFGMTTRIVWGITPALKAFEERLIAKTIREMTKRKLLESHPLHHGRFYFTLTEKAARDTATNCKGGPFCETNKIRSFVKLLIGVEQRPGYIPLPVEELSLRLKEKVVGLPDVFMADQCSKQILLVRIDVDPAQRAARTAQKLRHDVFRLANTPSLRSLVIAKQLEVALAACTESRAASILEHFRSYDRVNVMPVRIIVLPKLLSLLLPVSLGGDITINPV